MRRIILIYFIIPTLCFSITTTEDKGLFSGRISKINKDASLIRAKVDFSNVKYLNKKDKVEFWSSANPRKRCKGYIIARSTEYLLIKVPEFELCRMLTFVDNGVHLYFFSQDLINNMKMGREVISILQKKKLALIGQLETERKSLEAHMDKVEAINKRYEVLRQKLMAEWKQQLDFVEEDRITSLRNYKGTQIRLDEVEQKMERYRIEDENLTEDKWALDSKQYIKK